MNYHVTMSPDAPGVLEISLACSCFRELKEHGLREELEMIYGKYVVKANVGMDVTLRVDLNEEIGNKEALIKEIALLKCNVLGGPLYFF